LTMAGSVAGCWAEQKSALAMMRMSKVRFTNPPK
jgi:hypothetical protein